MTGYLARVQERLHARADRGGGGAGARAESERAKRRLAVALACSLVTMIALAGGGWAWASARRAEQVAARTRDVNDAVAEAKLHQGRASAPRRSRTWPLDLSRGCRQACRGVAFAGARSTPATARADCGVSRSPSRMNRRPPRAERRRRGRPERRLAERLAAIRRRVQHSL